MKSKSRSTMCSIFFGNKMLTLIRVFSEKEDIDLQLRAVPDIEQRIRELEASM